MSIRMLRCPHCGRIIQPGVTYCPFCGEAVAPALVAELQWLYGALNDLDTRIARGEGDQTITALRNEYRERYLSARRAPASTAPHAATTPSPAPAEPAEPAEPAVSAAPTHSSPPIPAQSVAPQPRPDGPVFSWQAFLSEQAIAIMMYMGGFLGLVAMLSFEIGGWQSLDLRVKLGAIIVVYLAFGALGLMMRRRPRLHTVGGAYLGVFALMTPLLALGIYRFGLQAAGFSGAVMLCLSAVYAAIVYLALAWRTRFVTYAYLGWSALVLSAMAAVSWAEAPGEAVVFALAFVSLLLLLPSLFRLLTFADLLEAPALQLAAVTSLAAAAGALFLGLALATRAIDETPLAVSSYPPPHYSTAIFALASCVLVLVACAWSYLARGLTREQEASARAGRLNVVDWLIVAMVTQAVIAVAAWVGADRRDMAVVLSALALLEAGALFILWRRARERTELRYLVETLALGLAIIACLGVASDPAPNWPYLLALTSGLVVTGGLAIFEATPLWLLPAGVFLSLDYYTLLDTLFHQPVAQVGADYAIPVRALAAALLTLALVMPWLIARSTPFTRRFSAPVYLIALGNALYATLSLLSGVRATQFRPDAFSATLILGLFVTLALVAGWRSRYLVIGGLAAAFFGFFLPLPLSVAGGSPRFVLGAAIAAVVVGLLALGARALLGRASALAAYMVALWMAVVVAFRLLINPNFPTDWRFLGYSLPVGLLLTLALLATIAILWENAPWAMFIPAFFGLVAAFVTPGASEVQGLALAVALAVVGIALRWFRGRWTWSIAWHLAALLASLYQILMQGVRLDSEGLSWRVLVGPLFMLLAYLAAASERQPWITAVAPFFALGTTFFFPTLQDFVPTLVMVYGMVLAGLALRLFFGRRWAVACYVAAIAPSLLAVWRAVPPSAGVHEALLLIFALTAYGIALFEREPAIGAVAAIYAGLAPFVQLNGRPLLGLTLALVGVGLVIGRIGGWRWAWPAYTAALVAGLVTTLVGYREPVFEAWALLALAVAAYLVALIESHVEALTLALILGALALLAADRALELAYWQTALSLVALSWLYTLGQWLWGALPWLRDRTSPPWWDPDAQVDEYVMARWRDTRRLGRMIHHAAGLLLGAGVAAGLALATGTYTPGTELAQVEVVALVSLGLLLALSAGMLRLHALWYVAGGLITIALSWQMRWLGADNIQAFVLAPGSYLLLIGALLPADRRFQNPLRAGQMASLLGALLLLLPTLTQSFTTGQSENWIYASALALEALVIAAIGVGAHARALLLLGTGFFGLAAIRGALLAYSSGVPVALIIAALALLLMGGATWLSLRSRREPGDSAISS